MNDIDETLVQRAREGDAQALRDILSALQGPLYHMALRMLGRHEDAEDATQESLLRIATHLGTFRGESAFSTWAWSVATRVALAHRKRGAQQALNFDLFEEDLSRGSDGAASARAEDAIYLQQVKIGCGRAMLQCLDDELRVAYVLGEILEVPGPEAAKALGISEAAFRKRMSRARALVRSALGRFCGVVNSAATCRCHKRLGLARTSGRLDARDLPESGAMEEVHQLRTRLSKLEDDRRVREFYTSEPAPRAATVLLGRIYETLRIVPNSGVRN